MCVSRAKQQDGKCHQENTFSHHYFAAFYLKKKNNVPLSWLDLLSCCIFCYWGNQQWESVRVSWGAAAWKVKCSIQCLRHILLQIWETGGKLKHKAEDLSCLNTYVKYKMHSSFTRWLKTAQQSSFLLHPHLMTIHSSLVPGPWMPQATVLVGSQHSRRLH